MDMAVGRRSPLGEFNIQSYNKSMSSPASSKVLKLPCPSTPPMASSKLEVCVHLSVAPQHGPILRRYSVGKTHLQVSGFFGAQFIYGGQVEGQGSIALPVVDGVLHQMASVIQATGVEIVDS